MQQPDHIADLWRVAIETLRPRGKPDICHWLENHVKIVDRASEYAGPFNFDNCPDLREVARAAVDPRYPVVVLVSPTQSYKTTLIIGATAYALAWQPVPVGWVMDTETRCTDFSQERWQPTLEGTPELAALKTPRRDDFTNLIQRLRPCTVRFMGSNSAGALASNPLGWINGDEVDKWPPRIRNEAGALELVGERVQAFAQSKILLASTPTVPEGPIWRSYLRGSQRHYFVPCPHCGTEFLQLFDHLRWDRTAKSRDGRWDIQRVEKTAHMECPHCQGEIWQHHRRDMLHAGRWRDTEPEPVSPDWWTGRRSCFNVLHPKRTFAAIARAHLEAGKDPSARQNFTNSWMAETYEEVGEKPDLDALLARREVYTVEPYLPRGVLMLTVGGDVQDNRVELEIVGWGRDYESWGIAHIVEIGEPRDPAFWRERIDPWLAREWPHPSGHALRPYITGIDSGHLATEAVYDFTGPRWARRIFATKGQAPGYNQPLTRPLQNTGSARVPLIGIGTHQGKEAVYTALRVGEPGPMYCHLPADAEDYPAGMKAPTGYDREWFRQVTAEKCIRKHGRPPKWIAIHGRNEALDLRVIAYAMARHQRVNWEAASRQMEIDLAPGETATAADSPPVDKSTTPLPGDAAKTSTPSSTKETKRPPQRRQPRKNKWVNMQ